MKAVSETDFVANIERMAVEAYAKHVIRSTNGVDRWVIAQPDCGFFATEIILAAFARIVIHGDGPDLILGRSSYRGTDLLPWAASSGLDYLESKVLCGEKRRWEPEVALAWCDEQEESERKRIADATDEDGFTDDEEMAGAAEQIEIIGELREALLRGTDERGFRYRKHELCDDFEWGLSAGYVPSTDLVYGREAVRTLQRLLDAAEKSAIATVPT